MNRITFGTHADVHEMAGWSTDQVKTWVRGNKARAWQIPSSFEVWFCHRSKQWFKMGVGDVVPTGAALEFRRSVANPQPLRVDITVDNHGAIFELEKLEAAARLSPEQEAERFEEERRRIAVTKAFFPPS